MVERSWHLAHSVLSPYLNIGLLLPGEVCDAVQEAYDAGARADHLGGGLHPPGDRLARVRVGRLLAVDARVPVDRNVLGADRPVPPAFTGDADHRDELRVDQCMSTLHDTPTTTTSSG